MGERMLSGCGVGTKSRQGNYSLTRQILRRTTEWCSRYTQNDTFPTIFLSLS